MVRSLRRIPSWSRSLALKRFEAKRAEIEARLLAIPAEREALNVEEACLRSMHSEVVATIEKERGAASARVVPSGPQRPGNPGKPEVLGEPQTFRYLYDESIEAWRRPRTRKTVDSRPGGLSETAKADPSTWRASLVFGVPGLLHSMAVAGAAHQRIDVDENVIPERARNLALTPSLGNCLFSLSACEALLNPDTSNIFITTLNNIR